MSTFTASNASDPALLVFDETAEKVGWATPPNNSEASKPT
jgi:hypothetical protein